MIFSTAEQAKQTLEGVVSVQGNAVQISDANRLRRQVIDDLIENALFHPSEQLRYLCHWLIRRIAAAEVIYPASAGSMHDRFRRELMGRAAVPVFGMRVLTYDSARACFQAARERSAVAFMFELSDGAMGYPAPNPTAFASSVLAAAVKEHYQGPVFLSAGWIRADEEAWRRDRDGEISRLRTEAQSAAEAGFFNFHFSAASLIATEKPTHAEQQRRNYRTCGELSNFVREIDPPGITSSVSGELGQLPDGTEAVPMMRAFLNGYLGEFTRRGSTLPSHVALSANVVEGVEPGPPLDVVTDLAEIGQREYDVGLAVRDLPRDYPENHYEALIRAGATTLQLAPHVDDWVFDDEAFPTALKEDIYRWADGQAPGLRRPGEGDQPFLYRARRAALDAFATRLWEMPEVTRKALREAQTLRFHDLFDRFGVRNSAGMVRDAAELKDSSLPPPTSGFHHTAESVFNDILDRLPPTGPGYDGPRLPG